MNGSDTSAGFCQFQKIIGAHPLMRHLYKLIELVAPTDVTVHINGESGVGKELVADAVHSLSRRSHKRFVKLNCSSIPGTLIESALFGHVKGAFTDAHKDAQGYVEYAEGGTVFLDEIGELSPEMQVKLLRLLQSHEYSRVGEAITRKADIRVITATNRNLEELLAQGKIREDFFYRINVFPLQIPPLRAKVSDILLLTEHFIAKFNERFVHQVKGIAPDALQLFERYHWPGNVRELENAIEHAFVLAQSDYITREHLPVSITTMNQARGFLARGTRYSCRQEQLEAEHRSLVSALEQVGGHRARAAKLLGISRVTLWKKMKQHNLNDNNPSGEDYEHSSSIQN